jgi:ferredoxin-NADP reductase
VETTTLRRRLTWQQAQVKATSPETPHARRLTLLVPGWPGHAPGQHVDVRLTAPDGYTAQRSYSIASPPQLPEVELIVERLEDGEVSPYLTGEVRAGDLLELRGPIGGYFVWPEPARGPVQLIAGGSGVVPFLAMLGHHRLTGSTVPVRLLYSVRTEDEVIGGPEFASRPAVGIDLTYTRASPPGWTGLTGRIDAVVLARHAVPAAEQPAILVCGPTLFVEAVARALTDLGHDPGRIKTERFGGMGERP